MSDRHEQGIEAMVAAWDDDVSEGWTAPEKYDDPEWLRLRLARCAAAYLETVVDYEAGNAAYDSAPVPIRREDFVRRIVDAALGRTE